MVFYIPPRSVREQKLMYQVNLWGSHPDAGNDDCWTGANFENASSAERTYLDPWRVFDKAFNCAETAYVELVGPDSQHVRRNPDYVPDNDNLADWRHEAAIEAGMLHGIDAFNDALGC